MGLAKLIGKWQVDDCNLPEQKQTFKFRRQEVHLLSDADIRQRDVLHFFLHVNDERE